MILGVLSVTLGKLGKQVGRRAALDQMIRHDGVHDIFGAALGHVASDTVFGSRMIGRIDNGVALAAYAVVMFGSCRAVRDVVGIVTSDAGATRLYSRGNIATCEDGRRS